MMGGGVGEAAAAAAARGGRTGHKCKTCKPKYAEADLSLLFSPYIFFHISRHNVVVDDDAVVGTKFDAAFFNSLSLSLFNSRSLIPSLVRSSCSLLHDTTNVITKFSVLGLQRKKGRVVRY